MLEEKLVLGLQFYSKFLQNCGLVSSYPIELGFTKSSVFCGRPIAILSRSSQCINLVILTSQFLIFNFETYFHVEVLG